MSNAARVGDRVGHGGAAFASSASAIQAILSPSGGMLAAAAAGAALGKSGGGGSSGGGCGAVVEGSPNVYIEGARAAHVGSLTSHGPSVIVEGAPGVFVNGQRLARVGDRVSCKGVVVSGASTVSAGGVAMAETAVVSPPLFADSFTLESTDLLDAVLASSGPAGLAIAAPDTHVRGAKTAQIGKALGMQSTKPAAAADATKSPQPALPAPSTASSPPPVPVAAPTPPASPVGFPSFVQGGAATRGAMAGNLLMTRHEANAAFMEKYSLPKDDSVNCDKNWKSPIERLAQERAEARERQRREDEMPQLVTDEYGRGVIRTKKQLEGMALAEHVDSIINQDQLGVVGALAGAREGVSLKPMRPTAYGRFTGVATPMRRVAIAPGPAAPTAAISRGAPMGELVRTPAPSMQEVAERLLPPRAATAAAVAEPVRTASATVAPATGAPSPATRPSGIYPKAVEHVVQTPSCATCSSSTATSRTAGPEATKRVDRLLKHKISKLRAGEHVVVPDDANKSGLLDHLRGKRNEFAVLRDGEGRLYVVKGSPSEVRPLDPNDRLVFHNHPSGSARLSADDVRFVGDGQPRQQTTMVGTREGVFRQSVRGERARLGEDAIQAARAEPPLVRNEDSALKLAQRSAVLKKKAGMTPADMREIQYLDAEVKLARGGKLSPAEESSLRQGREAYADKYGDLVPKGAAQSAATAPPEVKPLSRDELAKLEAKYDEMSAKDQAWIDLEARHAEGSLEPNEVFDLHQQRGMRKLNGPQGQVTFSADGRIHDDKPGGLRDSGSRNGAKTESAATTLPCATCSGGPARSAAGLATRAGAALSSAPPAAKSNPGLHRP